MHDADGFVAERQIFAGPIAPWIVCESEVQINARFVLTTASFGPGVGTGLSMNPTSSRDFITNAFIRSPPARIRPNLSVASEQH